MTFSVAGFCPDLSSYTITILSEITVKLVRILLALPLLVGCFKTFLKKILISSLNLHEEHFFSPGPCVVGIKT